MTCSTVVATLGLPSEFVCRCNPQHRLAHFPHCDPVFHTVYAPYQASQSVPLLADGTHLKGTNACLRTGTATLTPFLFMAPKSAVALACVYARSCGQCWRSADTYPVSILFWAILLVSQVSILLLILCQKTEVWLPGCPSLWSSHEWLTTFVHALETPCCQQTEVRLPNWCPCCPHCAGVWTTVWCAWCVRGESGDVPSAVCSHLPDCLVCVSHQL